MDLMSALFCDAASGQVDQLPVVTIYYDFTGGGSGEDSSIILEDTEMIPSKYASKAVVQEVKAIRKK